MEIHVEGTKGTVFLITTACYSGTRASEHWTLLAAAGPDEEGPSIVVSASEKHLGGFFTNVFIAEHTNQYQINAPCPGSVDVNGHRGPENIHDLGPSKPVKPFFRFPKPSLKGVCDWIHKFRDNIRRTYTSADITFHPCSSSGSHSIPFLPLDSSKAMIHRLICVPPLLSNSQVSSLTANSQRTIYSHYKYNSWRHFLWVMKMS